MAPVQYLGTGKVPPEMHNHIARLVLEHDQTAIILPRQITTAAALRASKSIACTTAITSRSALFRASKFLRQIYAPMFRQKALNMGLGKDTDTDVDKVMEVIVKVEDFDITTFDEVFQEFKRHVRTDNATAFPYDFHMSFSERFLRDPKKEPLVKSCEFWAPRSASQVVRFAHIDYSIKPIPIIYIDKLRWLLNDVCVERFAGVDPEFKHLLGVFRTAYHTREIIRPGDQDKNMVGRWIKGEFVIKEAHEWKDYKPDDGDEEVIYDFTKPRPAVGPVREKRVLRNRTVNCCKEG